ncbi:hypothetical protein B0A55_03872 [Friedmanniomyces simplex]|uniref:histidine kinase n=1 Tax=Friedmanniomyces simplex TaxID=329884 RepID=A0A4U0XQA6_9PEZI|nr:hypothetical protein B0A55_03872 [Friedmanniomyces simplex]
MAQTEAVDSRAHRVQWKKTLLENRREREFYRYYEPIQALTKEGPSLCDLYDEASAKSHRPLSSPDKALTAFCQLGALRLGCRRAMLFFFDSNYAYVLAEATRTLSLQDDQVHEIDDELWLGHVVIPRGFTICEETVCRLSSGDTSDADLMSHVISDLDEDTQFCGKPYVTDGPKAKFYAGVPITTDKGVNIGAYCCLDDRKRDGLDAKGVAFLQDMAKTVMTHLEMVRAKTEHERGTRMVSGLGAFIEGASSLQSWERDNERRDYRRVGGRAASPAERPPMDSLPSAPLVEATHGVTSQQSSAHSSSDSTATTGKLAGEAEPTDPGSRIGRQTTENMLDLSDQLIPPNVRDVFQRAADLFREAVGVDGVAFLDGSPNTYGGLVDAHDGSDQSSDAVLSATELTGTDSESRSISNGRGAEKACKVLASSHSPEDKFNSKGELQHHIQATTITERFLRSLLKRHPHGKIWNFSEVGDASSEDSASDSGTTSNFFDGQKDQNRGRWFSALAVWTYSPLRLFSQESEVNYMAAFCDVVMAEVYRLEAQNSDRAKSDFISSISHELRSPLHGILGSVECLQEQPFEDSFNSDLVSQIEVCGRTLLDIVEHLLDHSKINATTQASRGEKQQRSSRKRLSRDEDAKSSMGGLMSVESEVSLDAITEEVVEAAVYSYCCTKGKESILERRVTVILDVDHGAAVNWLCRVPLGGWKRICINLVSNAMKYTSEGYIHISLAAEPIPGKRKRFNAIFTIQDSGRGMSRDFLANQLFRAFSQEDSLVEGTGLGMNLVAKIVKAMGGKIDVQSEKGGGTRMTVTVPVEVGRGIKGDDGGMGLQNSALLEGCSVGILGFGNVHVADGKGEHRTSREIAREKLLRSLRQSCDQLGISTKRMDGEAAMPEADVYLIAEDDLSTYAQSQQLRSKESRTSGRDKPLIIICNSAISVRQLRATSAATGFTTQRVDYIAQPCGTERLSKAIRNCLQAVPCVRGPFTSPEEHAARGVISGVHEPGKLERPHVREGIDEQRSADLPLRAKSPGKSSVAEQKPALHSPAAVSPDVCHQQEGGAGSTVSHELDAPPLDYLSSRSKSMGDNPISPHAVEPVQSKRRPGKDGAKIPPPASGLSLLLVDDNQINLQLLVNYATKQGHRKTTATDGHQAVEAYKAACLASIHSTTTNPPLNTAGIASRSHHPPTPIPTPIASPIVAPAAPDKPQVILMDISMPILNGFEATRLIRAFEQQHGVHPPAHIVALTGLGSASAQQEAFSSGVDLFLTKPVRLKELTRVLEGVKRGDGGVGRVDTPVMG